MTPPQEGSAQFSVFISTPFHRSEEVAEKLAKALRKEMLFAFPWLLIELLCLRERSQRSRHNDGL